jgi:hypothetical protein
VVSGRSQATVLEVSGWRHGVIGGGAAVEIRIELRLGLKELACTIIKNAMANQLVMCDQTKVKGQVCMR